MEELSLLLGLFIVVFLFSYCTYYKNRKQSLDYFESKNNGQKREEINLDDNKNKILTKEQLDAMKTINDLMKEANFKTNNICKLTSNYCMNRMQNEYCNNTDMIDTQYCKASKNFCENKVFNDCYNADDVFTWMESLNDDDKNKLMAANKIISGL